MAETGTTAEDSDEVRQARAERDELHRELRDLRGQLSQVLGLLDREPGPDGFKGLRLPSDREILSTIRRLVVEAAPTYDVDKLLWAEIDRLILNSTKITAVQAIRERFGGGVHEALIMLHRRYDRLRWERSQEFAQDADSYWDGFQS